MSSVREEGLVTSLDTERMTNIIQNKIFSKTNIFLKREFVIPNTKKRADLGANIAWFDNKGMMIVEIKNSTRDFHSGYGMNFVGLINFLAVPSDLVGYAIRYLRENNLCKTGVIEVTWNNAYVVLPSGWMEEEGKMWEWANA